MRNHFLRAIILPLFLVSAIVGAGRADELDDFTGTLQRNADAISANPTKPSESVLRLLTELQAAISRTDVGRAQTVAGQLTAESSIPADLKTIVERLSRELPRLLAARADAFVTAVDAAVERTRKECPSARKETELTPLLRDLSALKQRQPAEGSAIVARALRKLEAAIKTADGWMDYLAASSTGDQRRAIEALRPLANENGAYPILPASEYVQRLGGSTAEGNVVGTIQAILAKIKTLRDVEVVAPEIDALQERTQNSYSPEIVGAKRWFTSFHIATASFLSGDIGNAWQRLSEPMQETGSWVPQALRLRGILLAELLPQYLKTAPGAERRPDETPNDHFQRMLAQAAREERWDDLNRAASSAVIASYLTGRGNNWLTELASSTATFLHARRLDEAGDYVGAILSYEKVLRSTAELAPVNPTIARLKVLRQTHPEAFAEAHPRVESDRVFQLIDQIERTLAQFSDRLARFEQERASRTRTTPASGAPTPQPADAPQATKTELQALQTKLKELEANLRKPNDLNARLEKLELLFGPAAEVLARESKTEKPFRIWLGADFTVYRSALPPKLEMGLVWIVRYNGKEVLSRNARNEVVYRYHSFRPGNYTVFLTLGSRDTPASNVLDFTISEEEAAKLIKRRDRDVDRDGVPNAIEGDDR